MGATGDCSPDRQKSSPKRRRHDSRSPSRKQRKYETERQRERSRHEDDYSREHKDSRESHEDSKHDRLGRHERGRAHDERQNRHEHSRGHEDRHQQQHKRDREPDRHEQQGRRDRFDRGDRHRQQNRPDYPSRNDRPGSGPDFDRPREDSGKQQRQEQQLEGSRGPREGRGPHQGDRQQADRQRGNGQPWQRPPRDRRDGDDGGGKQRWGKPEEWALDEAAAAAPTAPKEQPNMGLSGKLAAESNKTVDGTAQLKYQPPPEARVCKKPPWRLYVFKGQEEAAAPITLNQTPFYLFGKDRKVADIPTDHPSCSRQHAVLCFREVEVDAPDGIATMRVVKPYIIDLESVNGTHLNGERVEPARYYELLHQDVIKFGLSSREYVIMNEAAVTVK